jgi:hypothetical protein
MRRERHGSHVLIDDEAAPAERRFHDDSSLRLGPPRQEDEALRSVEEARHVLVRHPWNRRPEIGSTNGSSPDALPKRRLRRRDDRHPVIPKPLAHVIQTLGFVQRPYVEQFKITGLLGVAELRRVDRWPHDEYVTQAATESLLDRLRVQRRQEAHCQSLDIEPIAPGRVLGIHPLSAAGVRRRVAITGQVRAFADIHVRVVVMDETLAIKSLSNSPRISGNGVAAPQSFRD